MPEEISLKDWLERRDRRRKELASPVFIMYCDPQILQQIREEMPECLNSAEWTKLHRLRREQYLSTVPDCSSCGRAYEALTSVLGYKYCRECFRKEKAQAEGRFERLAANLSGRASPPATATDIRYHGDGKTEMLNRKRKGEK